jgi:hypothetical protein
VFAVTPAGRERVLMRSAEILRVHDIAKDGRVLASRETREAGIRYQAPGSREERDLSWLDRSVIDDLSDDGSQILFSELGDAGGAAGSVYIRKTDGSPAVRLGDGVGLSLSPDSKWALTSNRGPSELTLLPTGAGSPIRLSAKTAPHWGGGLWLPSGKAVTFAGMLPNHGPRIFVQPIDGEARPISREGLPGGGAISPDGHHLAILMDYKGVMIDIDHATTEPFPAIDGEAPLTFTQDGRSLLVFTSNVAATVTKVDVATGAKAPWKMLLPSDNAGVTSVADIHITPDERSYAYTYNRRLSELYVITGLK